MFCPRKGCACRGSPEGRSKPRLNASLRSISPGREDCGSDSTAAGAYVSDVERRLRVLGQSEEGVRAFERLRDEPVGDPMILQEEEAGFTAGVAEVRNEAGSVGVLREAPPVEDRDHVSTSRPAIRRSTSPSTRLRCFPRLSRVELSIR